MTARRGPLLLALGVVGALVAAGVRIAGRREARRAGRKGPGLLASGLAVAAMLGFIGAGVWLLAGVVAPRLAGSAAAAATPVAAPGAREPRLPQGYEWVDRERGIVRIPVERAMDLIAEDR